MKYDERRRDRHERAAPEAKDKASQQAPPFKKGDADAAFASAPVKVDQTYRTPYEHHHPMEAHSHRRRWDGDQSRCTTPRRTSSPCADDRSRFQHPARQRRTSCRRSSAARSGARDRAGRTCFIAALAAHELKRPVKLWLPRKQLFFTNGHRPETEQRVALGATQDGKLVSVIHEGISQSNAVCDYNERFTRPTRDDVRHAEHARRQTSRRAERLQPDLHARARREPRNVRARVGDGRAGRRAEDGSAAAPARQPRRRDPSNGKPWSSKSLKECYSARGGALRLVETQSGAALHARRALAGRQGMASATYPAHRSPTSARADECRRHRVIFCGSHEMGMGTATVMAQLAAETLGIPAERVRFEYGDTNLPQAPISAGSMTAASVGTAVYEASTALKKKLADMNNGAGVTDYGAFLHAHYLPSVEAQSTRSPIPRRRSTRRTPSAPLRGSRGRSRPRHRAPAADGQRVRRRPHPQSNFILTQTGLFLRFAQFSARGDRCMQERVISIYVTAILLLLGAVRPAFAQEPFTKVKPSA